MALTSEEIEQMEFGIWLDNGVRRGWVSLPSCAMHDQVPMTRQEEEELDAAMPSGDLGEAPCIHIVRVWR